MNKQIDELELRFRALFLAKKYGVNSQKLLKAYGVVK